MNNSSCQKSTSPYICIDLVLPPQAEDEKGNPVYLPAEGMESGAIPVAVKPVSGQKVNKKEFIINY